MERKSMQQVGKLLPCLRRFCCVQGTWPKECLAGYLPAAAPSDALCGWRTGFRENLQPSHAAQLPHLRATVAQAALLENSSAGMSSRFPTASPSKMSILAGLSNCLIVHHVANMGINVFEGNKVDSVSMTVAGASMQLSHRAHSGQACSVTSPKCAAVLAEPKQPCCKSQVPPCCTC